MSTHPSPLPKPDSTCISGVTNCGYALTQTFTCVECRREVCWCAGGDDDLCADCNLKEKTHA